MKKLMMAAALAAVACGCVSVNKNDGAADNLVPGVVKDSVHIKYDIKKTKVEGTETIQWLNLGFIGIPLTFTWGGTADHYADYVPMGAQLPFFGPSISDSAKNGAYAKACSANDADAIVAARYKVTNTSYFVYGTAKADIVGYPAKMVDVEVVNAK